MTRNHPKQPILDFFFGVSAIPEAGGMAVSGWPQCGHVTADVLTLFEQAGH